MDHLCFASLVYCSGLCPFKKEPPPIPTDHYQVSPGQVFRCTLTLALTLHIKQRASTLPKLDNLDLAEVICDNVPVIARDLHYLYVSKFDVIVKVVFTIAPSTVSWCKCALIIGVMYISDVKYASYTLFAVRYYERKNTLDRILRLIGENSQDKKSCFRLFLLSMAKTNQ
jgi:hypothetical protein